MINIKYIGFIQDNDAEPSQGKSSFSGITLYDEVDDEVRFSANSSYLYQILHSWAFHLGGVGLNLLAF